MWEEEKTKILKEAGAEIMGRAGGFFSLAKCVTRLSLRLR